MAARPAAVEAIPDPPAIMAFEPPAPAELRSTIPRGSAAAAATAATLAAIWFLPDLSPALATVAMALAVAAAWAGRAGVRRREGEVAVLAAENAALARALEEAADRAWELRESEERYRSLNHARQRAEAASLAKSRFLATVSHEFRTPLNGILGLNSLLLETGLTSAQETYARGVQSSGSALLTLIEDMLDFSRIEAGRLDIRKEPADLDTLVAEVAELLAGRAHQKGIEIAASVDPGMPPLVEVDPARLRQVLVNLAGNAVKFTDSGGVTIAVDVERCEGDRVQIGFSVADTGPGIPPEEAERLFGEFEQADSALTRRHGGAGLGLAISRRIVEGMGGDLRVSPRRGGGSVFGFALDLRTVAIDAPAPPSLAGRRILVVMPDGAESAGIVQDLTLAGAAPRRVATINAASALAAAAAAAALPYDAILVDRRIVADPEGALLRLREAAAARTPCVMLIAAGERGEVDRLRDARFDGYLVRPIRRRSLVRIVGDATATSGAFHVDQKDAEKAAPPPARRATAAFDVLLAEDNEISALLARAVIEASGHTVTEVRDGHAAVAAATGASGRYAAVFLDLHMPGLDGIEVAARIRHHERAAGATRVPIVALTADALPETRTAALAAGIDSLLEKPVAPEALRGVLSGILERRGRG